MKKAMIDYMQKEKNDELFTPKEAIEPLLPYIDSSWSVWEPTDCGESIIAEALQANGNRVYGTHIAIGMDFFNYEPRFTYDVVITNPPYSLKTEFLRRAFELNTKFAFLLPITTLEGIERNKLFKQYGIEVLVLNRRINFTKKKNVWFNVSWFCKGILPSPLMFTEVNKQT